MHDLHSLPRIEGAQVIDADVTAIDQTKLAGLYAERAISFVNDHKEITCEKERP
jgi:hypothetical protein